MKTSLKQKLHNLIKGRQRITYGEMAEYVNEEGYRISNAERRLRELKEDGLISVESKKSRRGTIYISAYLLGTYQPPKPTVHIVEVDGEMVARMI